MLNKEDRFFNRSYLVNRALQLRLSHRDIANRCGITIRAVNKWFRGANTPKEKHIRTLTSMGFSINCLVKNRVQQENNRLTTYPPIPDAEQQQLELPKPTADLARLKQDVQVIGTPSNVTAPGDEIIKTILDNATPKNAWVSLCAIKKLIG